MATRSKQWDANNQANGSPIWGPRSIKQAANDLNANAMFENQVPNYDPLAGVNTVAVGVFGVNAASLANSKSPGIHTGWVKQTIGTGRRSGRVQYETLVAGGMSGNSANFNIVITSQPSGVSGAHPQTMRVGAFSKNGASLTYQWTWAANATAIPANSTVLNPQTNALTWNVAATANVIYVTVSDGTATYQSPNITFTVT